jgi:hypothetical protein
MTIANHEMNQDEQSDFFDAIERVNRAGSALKVIAWSLGGLTAAGLAVAGWVLQVNWAQAEHGETLKVQTPRVEALETRAVRFDAAPPPSQAQFHDIDKRLDRMEQNSAMLREQTALILEAVKKLEARP